MGEISTVMECDVAELEKGLQSGARNLIDVREYAEFAGGRVKGAKLIPLGDIEKRYSEIDRDQTAYLICRTGKRAAEAQRRLLALGFTDVRNVRGGFEAWKAAGLEYEKDPGAVWSLERQVRFTAGSLVLVGVVLALLLHPYFIALSGFVGAGLVFAATTDTCAMGMMLMKLPWNKSIQATCEVPGQKV